VLQKPDELRKETLRDLEELEQVHALREHRDRFRGA